MDTEQVWYEEEGNEACAEQVDEEYVEYGGLAQQDEIDNVEVVMEVFFMRNDFFFKKMVVEATKLVFLQYNSKSEQKMAETSIILSEIEVKVRKLIDAKKQLIEENRLLANENRALREENEAYARASQELQEKLNKTTIVNALGSNEEEIKEGRKLIRELIKEIDQCVSILNSKE